MWAMSDDGVDSDGFPPSEAHEPADMIMVEIVGSPDGQFRISVDSTIPDRARTARTLRLAADAMDVAEDGPAITQAGHLIERLSGYGE